MGMIQLAPDIHIRMKTTSVSGEELGFGPSLVNPKENVYMLTH